MEKININKIAHLTGHKGGVFSLADGSQDHLFLSGAGDGWIVEWNLTNPKDGRLVAQAEDTQTSGRASVFSLLEKDEMIVAGNMNGGLHWIFPKDTSRNKDILPHKKGIFDAQVFDNQLFTIGGKGVLTKWSIEEQRAIESIQLSQKSLRKMTFSKKRNELAIGASDGNIYFLDLENFSLKNTIEVAHDNSVFALSYSPDEKYLWSGGRDALLKIWNLEKNYEQIFSEPAHWFTINAIVFSPDGKYGATASRDKTIKIWDAENFQLLKVIDTIRNGGHINSVNTLLWSKYNNWLISGSDDRSLIIWEITTP
ncbi:MAG: WD40 repeat domain-containing protein [Saprospiraceae bacterium]